MKDEVYRLFDSMVENFSNQEFENQVIDEEVERQMTELKEMFEISDQEAVQDRLFEVAHTAKREGFVMGFRYAVVLLLEDGGSGMKEKLRQRNGEKAE